MPRKAKLYIGVTTALGLALLAGCLFRRWQCADPTRYVSYLLLAALSSVLKLKLPKIQGTISVNFQFILIGVAQLGLSETLLLGCGAAAIQCLWKPKTRPKVIQILFNVAALAISISVAYPASHALSQEHYLPEGLVLAACILFVANTGLVSLVLSLLGQQSLGKVWRQCYLWTFPYYLVGTVIVGLIVAAGRLAGWKLPLLILPLMYLVYTYFRFYLAQRSERDPACVAG